MVEREPPKETSQSGESILTQDFVEQILTTAQENLRASGYLSPVLLVHLAGGQRLITELELPETTEEKEAYFTRMGRSFRRAGQRIHEAVFVAETWYVDVREAPDAFTVRPSQHPARKEAISIVGRNAQGTRHTFLVQPYSRDRHNQPVFEPIPEEMAQFNVLVEGGTHGVGLLDHLFAKGRRRRKRPRRPRRRRF